MTKTKKEKTEVNAGWADYFAIQLTPQEKEANRAELKKEMERAAAEGVYAQILAYREMRVRERAARVSTARHREPAKKRGRK